MKMKQRDFDALRTAVLPCMKPLMVGERYRWDALWASGFNTSPLYKYLDDSNIDTALRTIESEVRTNWMQG